MTAGKFSGIAHEILSRDEPPIDAQLAEARLKKLIDYAVLRFHGYENERDKLLKLAFSIAGVAGFSSTLLFNENVLSLPVTRALFFATIIAALVMALSLIIIFVQGTKLSYTHRSVADVNGWFFRYTIPKDMDDKLVDGGPDDIEKLKLLFKDFLKSNINFISNPNKIIADDLQQLFILYIFQDISSKNHNSMIELIRWAAPAVITLLISSIVSGFVGI